MKSTYLIVGPTVRLALALRIPKIIVPFGAGVGSAIGMLEADAKLDASMPHVLKLSAGAERQIVDIYSSAWGKKCPCAGRPRVVKKKNSKRTVSFIVGSVSRHQLGIALDVRAGT